MSFARLGASFSTTWQNGIAERSGATLKALAGAVIRAQTCTGHDDMAMAVGEAVAAYNSDVNEEGVSPLQAVTGRQQAPVGDVLNGLHGHLAEHELVARVAMVRMHFSRGLRRAELARSRSSTLVEALQPGDLCFYWRASKYNPKKGRANSGSKHRLQLRRWHGPALLVAIEGGANAFLSHGGQLTKCGLEHVRKASPLEQIAAGSWEEAIKDVIDSVPVPEDIPVPNETEEDDNEEMADLFAAEPETPVPSTAIAGIPNVEKQARALATPLSPSEVAAALQPPSRKPSAASSMPPPPLGSVAHGPCQSTQGTGTVSPSTPGRRSVLAPAIQRAQAFEPMVSPHGSKRSASQPLPETGRERASPAQLQELPEPPVPSAPSTSSPAFEALTLTWEQLCNLSATSENIHPLLRLQAQAEMDRRAPFDCLELDHGSWDGRWSFLCQDEWNLQSLGQSLPLEMERGKP